LLLPPPRPLPLPEKFSPPLDVDSSLHDPIAVAPGAGQQPNDPERNLLLSAARNAANRGDWETAIARFEEFFRRFGEDPIIRREFAGILVQAGQTRRAIEQYQQLLRRNPENVALRVLLGDLSLLTKDYRQAVVQYQQALQIRPGNIDVAARLARAHLLNGDVARALEVYDRYLAKVRPGDERVPRALGALLIDLGRPRDALSYLLALYREKPKDTETIALIVRAYARIGDREQAIRLLPEIARAVRGRGVLLDLGETLYASGDYEVARRVYEQVLADDPGNGNAIVGLARIHLQLFQPAEACRLLESFTPAEAVRRIHRLTRAEYYQAVGEYVEAIQIYQQFLRENRRDYEVRLALAELYAFIREEEKAKAEFSKIPPGTPQTRRARLGFANAVAAQWHLAEAADLTRKLAGEAPGDASAVSQLVRILGKAHKVEEAVDVARGYLSAFDRYEPGCIAVRFALAKVFLDAGRPAEAAGEYDWLLARPAGRVTEAFYGLAVARTRMGRHKDAKGLTASALGLSESEARNRILLADLHYRDYDDLPAIDLLLGLVKGDPHNLSALIRLADAQTRAARVDAHIGPALQTTDTILRLSPTNVRGRLARARARATVQDFKGAVVEYDKLLAAFPRFLVPQREKARVLYSDHQYGAAQAAYQAIQSPSADELLHKDLLALTEREPRLAPLLKTCTDPEAPGQEIRAQIAKVMLGLADEDLRDALQGVLADADARAAEQRGAHLEAEAKAAKGWRNYQAVPLYQALVAEEPGNTEGLFDLGQVYGGLKQTHNALEQFARTLEVDPLHRESAIAQERGTLEMSPQLRPYADFFHQFGRNGLAAIDRFKYGVNVFWPYRDENEWIQLGYSRAFYQPVDDRGLNGNILTAGIQSKFLDGRLLLHGIANLEQYQDRLHTRVTYDVGADYDVCDLLHVRATSFLQNVVENGETLRQDIYRLGMTAGADLHLTRWWNVSGTYRYAHYSDHNELNELLFNSEYSLTLPPKQLKFVGSVFYQSFAEPTIFLNPEQAFLPGTIHPYFAPAGFTYYEGRVEWYHWLSRDYFTYSNQCWYSVQAGLGWDNRFAVYYDVRTLANYDVKPWLTVGAYGQALLSKVYDYVGAGAFAVIRFPCRPLFSRLIGCSH
jgi:tetratricopeptide (TPR) repeat protein